MPKYKYKRQDKRIEHSECNYMILAMPTDKLRALISILYISGGRISEVLRLKPENIVINRKDKTVKILMISLKRGKSDKGSQEARPLIFNLNTPFMDIFLESCKKTKKGEEIFKDLDRFKVWYYIHKANKFCSPHMFRHSRLQKLADSGATAYQIRSFAGHSKLDSSLSYIQASEFTLKPLKDMIS